MQIRIGEAKLPDSSGTVPYQLLSRYGTVGNEWHRYVNVPSSDLESPSSYRTSGPPPAGYSAAP